MSEHEYEQGVFTAQQVHNLLQPINPDRIVRSTGHSHVSQQDVTAHLIRMFGFGGHSTEILDLQLIREQVRPVSQVGVFKKDGKDVDRAVNPQLWKYDVVYRCTMRLTVFTKDHAPVGPWENSSTGEAQNQWLWDGHDLAMKSAISLALKRCTINLGDQFGLSLYNKGQEKALVMDTKVLPQALIDWRQERAEAAAGKPAEGDDMEKDVQAGVEKQVALGVDETAYDSNEATDEQAAALGSTLGEGKS